MARQVIDIGALSLEGEDGDTTREGFSKVNANFAEVYTSVQSATTGKVDKEAGKSLVLDTEITKLATVQANATQNSTDAFLRNRLNHTGVQDIATVSGLQAALDSKATTSALGTAAFTASTAYATAAQGTKADTAVQPNSLGTAAYTNSNAYATSLQGTKADTALQPAAIGTTVQGYSTNLVQWSALTVNSKQNTLISGTNIKTVNGASVLGSGNLTVDLDTSVIESRITTLENIGKPFTKEYISPEQTLTVGGLLTLTHGLGGKPKLLTGSYVCKVADAGYSPGDEFNDSLTYVYTADGTPISNTASYDSQSIFLIYGNAFSSIRVRNKTTGALTNIVLANWRYIVRAWA